MKESEFEAGITLLLGMLGEPGFGRNIQAMRAAMWPQVERAMSGADWLRACRECGLTMKRFPYPSELLDAAPRSLRERKWLAYPQARPRTLAEYRAATEGQEGQALGSTLLDLERRLAEQDDGSVPLTPELLRLLDGEEIKRLK